MDTLLSLSASVIAVTLIACGGGQGDNPDGSNGNGNGDGGDGDGGGGGGSDAQPCGQLNAIIRDFKSGMPSDFEGTVAGERGLVTDTLGTDHKPVYAYPGVSPSNTVAGPDSFNQWYNDVNGVNQRFEIPLPLTETAPGVFEFDDADFFPLDGMGFGDEGNPHNFHFTTEIHGTFLYRGGEEFKFRGDDDVFVFVNNKLALDLGGVHGPEEDEIDFDARAAELGISTGTVYALDVFHAERHTTESNFRIETSIDCLSGVIY
ncbi:MAG: fibro-slime domain-containing protein [Kofleriaceae bacterium]|nr:fibro-slime domain-containing protein [Kofleriaceae bacterium]